MFPSVSEIKMPIKTEIIKNKIKQKAANISAPPPSPLDTLLSHAIMYSRRFAAHENEVGIETLCKKCLSKPWLLFLTQHTSHPYFSRVLNEYPSLSTVHFLFISSKTCCKLGGTASVPSLEPVSVIILCGIPWSVRLFMISIITPSLPFCEISLFKINFNKILLFIWITAFLIPNLRVLVILWWLKPHKKDNKDDR